MKSKIIPTISMQGIWFERVPKLRSDIALPTPKFDEALIKLQIAGICATDLQILQGYYPFTGILGHEFVGKILAAPNAPERIGQRVVGEITISCDQCRECKKHQRPHCSNRSVLGILNRNGVFAEYTCLPLKNLHEVPSEIPNEIAVFTEPLAAALRIQQQVSFTQNQKVLLIGAGKLGQLIARSVSLTECELNVVARYPTQKELLSEHGIFSISESEIYPNYYDIVIEATGNERGLKLAQNAVKPQGTLVLKSTFSGNCQANLSPSVVKEINLIGSRCGPFDKALYAFEKKLINPSDLISKRFPLEEAGEALAFASTRGALKVLIEN